ncbi:DUF4190 domain-containing protein [Streptomyces sp. F63]|uniref:DUF4190 domain-containing protein n=1 Tax=Streptomyces sp. F63 TaxID=2824887 RepID=UPI001B3884A8|nr:DUF4190 domain-containing protein [Streptomyces sp. F63]MBQ0984112.1 DUF4190 domain-containing protein [Streptomyces sp. F63]
MASPAYAQGRSRPRDPNDMAVASFVLGLLGLLVMNVVLGPMAVALAVTALRRATVRRGRAFLGLSLGVADLVVFAVLSGLDSSASWTF